MKINLRFNLLALLLVVGAFSLKAQYVVGFEGPGETKNSYASGTVKLTGLDWNLTEALINPDAYDWKNGLRSARLRGYGGSVMTMLENKNGGLGSISFSYRRYSTDIQVDWMVEYSTDDGANWTQIGDAFTAPASNDISTFNQAVNVTGNVRVRIKRATETGNANRRLNIDDITLTDYSGGGNIPPSITNVEHHPSSNINPTTSVSVSADVTDTDGTITSVQLKWSLVSGSLTNTIPMAVGIVPNYVTTASIPAQADGTTVYYAVSATDNGAASTTTVEYSYIVTNPATKLAFIDFPAVGQQGSPVVSFKVQAQRNDNTPDANYSGQITLSKASGPGNVGGTLAKNAVNGEATFSDIQFDQTGDYTLHADAAGLTQATSPQVSISAGPVLTEVIMPQYIQGINGTNNSRVPFAYRLSFSNLNPNATYRYINQMIIATDNATAGGAGNVIFVNADHTFTRTTGPSLATDYGEFTTDGTGAFTGWFITEPSGNARFTPGNEVFVRVQLNDGAGGTTAATRLTSTLPVKVINFGIAADPNQGTAIRAESNAQAKNFAFLFDNTAGTGRPLFGTSIEITGIDFGASTSWAAFYRDNVAGENGAWGGIIPNMNVNGVKLVQERKLTDGTVASSLTSNDGIWGGQNTVNPNGGTTSVIVLDLAQGSVLTANPLNLNGFTYEEGHGPSATQSAVVSGTALTANVTVQASADYEISLTDAPAFVGNATLTLTPSGGTLANTTIFVRLKSGLAEGAHNGQLALSSTGAGNVTVNLTGNVTVGVVEPAAHATAFTATALDFSRIKLDWTDAVPAAQNYLIKGSTLGFGDIAAPVDGVPEANAALVRNVASGLGTFTFTALESSKTYYFKIFPYNGTAAQTNYKIDGVVPQASATTLTGPVLTEIIMPQYIQGVNGTNNNRVPFAFRLSLSNLNPNATYRYLNQIVVATDPPTAGGAGNAIYVNADHTFTRTTGPSLATTTAYGEFTTDGTGAFTGWFITEPSGNAKFTPGNEVFVRIQLNDGAGGTTAATRLTSTLPVKVINFGTAADPNQGTAIRAESNAQAKNFAFLFDNTAGTGRPLFGTSIEITGIDFGASTSWAAFYRNNVAGENGAWGGIIPNANANGVKRLEERKLIDGTVASTQTRNDGVWNGQNTQNPTGGTTNVIVIDLNVLPSVTATPLSLSGFTYSEGQGPSTTKSITVSGNNLISNVVVLSAPHYELSLTDVPDFSPSGQINLNASGGTLANTTIYVRLKAGLAAGAYDNESVYVASSGAQDVAVSLSGNVTGGVAEPAAHATAFTANALDFSKIKLDWTDAVPAAQNYLIKGSTTGFGDIAAPVDGVPEANAALVRNVASGVGTYTFAGLESNKTYYFKIFPYNGTAAQINYKTNGTVPQASTSTPQGPVMSEELLPENIIGNPVRLPYAFRLSFTGLLPNATYKYINQAVNSSDSPTAGGAGNAIYVSVNGSFTRTTGASFTNPTQHGEFVTNATGNYTGWFMLEPTTNARFTPGSSIFMRIRLNNGAGGTTAETYFTTLPVKVIGFGTNSGEYDGTALRATSAFNPGNFVFLYDRPQQNALFGVAVRPVAGTAIESTGIDFSTTTAYPLWFRNLVAGQDGAFGTVVPNILPNGITLIEERSNSTGAVVETKTAANGLWGSTNTVNPTGGGDQVLVLELGVAQNPVLVLQPDTLSGFAYFLGQGPSVQQSFVVSGTLLTGDVTLNAPAAYDISLGGGAQFVAQNPIVLTPAAGTLANTEVFVRLKAGLNSGNYNQQLLVSTSGADNKTLVLMGSVAGPANEPENHPTAFTLTATGMNSLKAVWADAFPAAAGYLLKGSTEGFNAITAPVDGVTEAEGQLVKYVEAGVKTATFIGLNPETTYYFKIFAFNGNGIAINYKTDGNVPQASAATQGVPMLSSLILPRFIQGFSGTNNNRLPFAFRVELKNLLPNATYRYTNQAVNSNDSPTASGAGNPIYVVNNDFYRSTNPGFVADGQYGTFTTDASGTYRGWFMLEATGNSRFTPGQDVFMRLRLNNGQGGTTATYYFTTEAVTVLGFSENAGLGNGTGIRANSSASPKNFAFIYDNVGGTGRPIYGTSIETTGIDYTATTWAAFYRNEVAGHLGAWGGIVPNNNNAGVRRIEERSLTDGSVVSSKTSGDGYWGLTNTVNPTGGLSNILVLDLAGQGTNNKIAGQFRYFNANESLMPVNNPRSVFYVQLFENGVAVRPRQMVGYSPDAGLDAYFEFGNIETGRNYTLRLWEQTPDNHVGSSWTFNHWGGVSAVDALIVSFMSAGNPAVSQMPWLVSPSSGFTPHFFNVADANNSNSLSAVDALLLQYRMTNNAAYNPLPGGRHNFQIAGAKVASYTALTYPQAPTILFEPHGTYSAETASDAVYYESVLPATESGLNIINVYYSAIGDMNASYVPGPAARSSVKMEIIGQMEAVDGDIRIPVYAMQDMELGAMSLELTFDSRLMEIVEVEAPGLHAIHEGSVMISWFDQQARHFKAGESIAYVTVRPLNGWTNQTASLGLGNQTEFADAKARIIEGVQLQTIALTVAKDPQDDALLSSVYPNPFDTKATISMQIPEAGLTTFIVFNTHGQQVYMKEVALGQGSQTLNLEASQLGKAGVYFYRIVHTTATRTSFAKGSLLVQ
ncbi:hypothetical protein MASR2M12_04480 [Bacteroidales bacterium]